MKPSSRNKPSKHAATQDAKEPQQRLRAPERKRQLIAAAQRVFLRQGFHGTRTRDLAEEAGVNEATFFMHFDSKDAIFDAAITLQLKTLVQQQTQESQAFAAAPAIHVKDQIGTQAIRKLCETIIEMAPLLVAVLFDSRMTGKDIYKSDIYPMIQKLGAAARLSFNLKTARDGEFIALAAMGLCFSLYIHHKMLGTELDLGFAASRISNLLMHGAGLNNNHRPEGEPT